MEFGKNVKYGFKNWKIIEISEEVSENGIFLKRFSIIFLIFDLK